MPIEKYSFGEIDIDGKQYQGDLIITDNQVIQWPCLDHHHPLFSDFPEIAHDHYDVLIIGTGYSGAMEVSTALKNKLQAFVDDTVIVDTRKACKIYNQRTLENKKIIAYLHLTC